jgi:hypothetical protein
LLTNQEKCEADHMTSINQWCDKLDTSEQQRIEEVSKLREQLQKAEQQRVTIETDLTQRNR